MAKKSVAQLEEELALARLALSEAKKKKMKEAENDDNGHVDMVDVKKGKKKDDDDEDGDEDDAEDEDDKKSKKNEAAEWGTGAKGKEPDVKDTDADDKDAKDYGDEHPSDKDVVGEETDDDAEDDEDDKEDAKGKKEKEEDDAVARKDEAKKRSKKLKKLMQSYREEDQPPVETLGSPFGDLKVAESVATIFDGETLSEDFKKKASTVFEAALTSRLSEEIAKIESAAQKALTHAVSEIEEDLMTKADDYVGYVVSEWLEENKLQVETALRAEIHEGFFEGLKALFVEHNISIPADKLDMLEAKEAEVAELTESNNALALSLIEKDKAILELKKHDILAVLSEGLAATQVEKLKTLTKDIEAKTCETFKEKATIIRESYFKEAKPVSKKDAGDAKSTSEAAVDTNVQKYLDHAKKFNQ